MSCSINTEPIQIIKLVSLRFFFIILVAILFSCHRNTSDILPGSNLKFLNNYHCWPYDVNVYSIDKVKLDSVFFSYPLRSYFGENPKYQITTWTKYDEKDINIRHMKSTLQNCVGNSELYNQLLNGIDIYYTGTYQSMKNKKGEKFKSYEKILFLDLVNRRIHIFEDIN